MTVPMLGLLVNPHSDDPIETAVWYARFSSALPEEVAKARAARDAANDADDITADHKSEDTGVDELVKRWTSFKPSNAEWLRAAVKGLRALGYQLALSEPRSGAGSRTYLRVLRADGANLGYMNSTSFSFVGASAIADGQPDVQSGRYPYIPWAAPNSVETVVNVAHHFLEASKVDAP